MVAKNTSGEVVVFDAASLEELARFAGEGYGEGTSVRFSPCGRYLIDGSWGGRLLVREADSGSVAWEEAGADGAIFGHAMHARDRTFWVYRRWTGVPRTPS